MKFVSTAVRLPGPRTLKPKRLSSTSVSSPNLEGFRDLGFRVKGLGFERLTSNP